MALVLSLLSRISLFTIEVFRNLMCAKSTHATIKLVASVAGVSTQTVSRVINERPNVSLETRRKVQEVIDELNYRPNALARSLISHRSHTLGVVMAGLENIGSSLTLSGIVLAAENAGYSILLKNLPVFGTNEITPIFHALLSLHVDGIIWAVPDVGENRKWINKPLFDNKVPIVYLTTESLDNLSVVSIDNYLGGRMAMTHLLEQGYRKIGHISGPLDWWSACQRNAAWSDALKEAGLPVNHEHWVEGNWSSESGARGFEILIGKYPEMDSVFVGNDQMALGVMQIARQKGVRIPNDIALVGFDDIPESAYFWPPLTTIRQDQYSLGKIAVENIIKTIESIWDGTKLAEPASTTILSPTLIVRKSSLRCKEALIFTS